MIVLSAISLPDAFWIYSACSVQNDEECQYEFINFSRCTRNIWWTCKNSFNCGLLPLCFQFLTFIIFSIVTVMLNQNTIWQMMKSNWKLSAVTQCNNPTNGCVIIYYCNLQCPPPLQKKNPANKLRGDTSKMTNEVDLFSTGKPWIN